MRFPVHRQWSARQEAGARQGDACSITLQPRELDARLKGSGIDSYTIRIDLQTETMDDALAGLPFKLGSGHGSQFSPKPIERSGWKGVLDANAQIGLYNANCSYCCRAEIPVAVITAGRRVATVVGGTQSVTEFNVLLESFRFLPER